MPLIVKELNIYRIYFDFNFNIIIAILYNDTHLYELIFRK